MKRIFLCLGALLLALCPFSLVSGEPITHNFHTMQSASTISFNPGYTYASTTSDDITYTCAGNACFAPDHVSPSATKKVSIYMPSYGDNVIISPAINGLAGIRITYYPSNEYRDNLKIYLSSDGSDYGSPISGTYNKGLISFTFPAGNFYVKLLNNAASKPISIIQMEYTIEVEDCNCFRYVPE